MLAILPNSHQKRLIAHLAAKRVMGASKNVAGNETGDAIVAVVVVSSLPGENSTVALFPIHGHHKQRGPISSRKPALIALSALGGTSVTPTVPCPYAR